ncbi:MAG: hypothetical protein ACYDBQ_11920 [Thermoplasmatota archaeon]
MRRSLVFLFVMMALIPAAAARSASITNCNGTHLTYETTTQTYTADDGSSYAPHADGTYDDPPVDLCARGQAGFMSLVFLVQVWGGALAILGIAGASLLFMFAGGNAQKRSAATGAIATASFALVILIFAVDIVHTIQNLF